MKFTGILKRSLNLDAFALTLKINDIMKHFKIVIEILNKSNDSIRLMKLNMLHLRLSAILIDDRECRVQVSSLMHMAFDIIFLKTSLLEDLRIRKEIDLRSGLLRLTDLRKKSVLQRKNRNTSLITVMMDVTLSADLYIHISRQRIHDRRTDSVQTSARLIRIVIKFTSGMQRGENDTCGRHAFGMHAYRNASSIILYGTGSVRFQCHPDCITHACQMLVHRVVNNLVN